MGEPLRVGVVGCGVISSAYLTTLAQLQDVEVVAVSDLVEERAAAAAQGLPGVRAMAPEELAASPDVDLVLNLTLPAAHAEVDLLALGHAKHVYSEKPIAATTAESQRVLTEASQRGLRVGCAPDTVLGTGLQTARAVLDAGGIGTPHAATAFFASPGHELWHPRPRFYYEAGGGPLFDMGPYYLSALVQLLGPVRRACGASSRPRPWRVVKTGPLAGTKFPTEVDTHVTGVLEHVSGALSTLVMSFDVWGAHLPRVEVHGTEGSLSVPDPNNFSGKVERYGAGAGQWEEVPPAGGYVDASRGYGVADMALAMRAGQPHRASAELAHHVLEVMSALLEAAGQQNWVTLESTCTRPGPVPLTELPRRSQSAGRT